MLETATRKRGLLDTRIKDSVQMMELVVKSFREKGDDASPSKSDPFIWRDKERRYRELLEDCQRLITSFQRELNSLPDPSNLRGDSASRILERLRGMVGEGRELNGREVLLLCERLVKSENVVMQLRDREGCLAEELMAAEKKKEEVEKSIPRKQETIVEVELTITQKQYYKAMYDRNRSFLYKGCKRADIPSLMHVETQLRKVCNHPFLVKVRIRSGVER